MNKRNIAKLEKLVEKLKTASPREAYNAVCELEGVDILHDILEDALKEDFSIAPSHARFFFCNDRQYFVCGMYDIEMFYHFSSDDDLELKIVVAGQKQKTDEHMPKGTLADAYSFGIYKKRKGGLPTDIISKLSDFTEESSGFWARSFGKIKNISQFEKEVLPVWNATLEMLKSFEEE